MTDMTVKEIINTQQEIYRLLAKKQIKKVFELLSELSSVLQDWTVNEKLNELENELKNMGFVRAHLSFLVNMKYITQISSYVMTLTTGKKNPVAKARYAQVKREYMLYKGEE